MGAWDAQTANDVAAIRFRGTSENLVVTLY